MEMKSKHVAGLMHRYTNLQSILESRVHQRDGPVVLQEPLSGLCAVVVQ